MTQRQMQPQIFSAAPRSGDEMKISENFLGDDNTILLIDDEEMVLDVGSQLLSRMGYSVLTASSGSEAIDIYEVHKEQVQLIILDLCMPDMDGKQTYLYLKGMNPAAKVLLTTGLSMDGSAKEMLACGCNGFIQKPYRMSELSTKVSEILSVN
jgi:CheY-like chemotaxis protein